MTEVRVWCENGDLCGYSEAVDGSFRVADADKRSGYYWFDGEPFAFSSQAEAEQYAQQWAVGYVEWLRETCDCDDAGCGVFAEHGYSIQLLEGN